MITKYDVGDTVIIKAKIHKIYSEKAGEVKYLLKIPNTSNYAPYKEYEITSKVEDDQND